MTCYWLTLRLIQSVSTIVSGHTWPAAGQQNSVLAVMVAAAGGLIITKLVSPTPTARLVSRLRFKCGLANIDDCNN